MPFSSLTPRSSNAIPEPATRSLTVLETSTSPGCACDATRAPVWTAMPATLPSTSSHSPVCELAHAGGDRRRAANRAGRPVEGCEEAVAGGIDLDAAITEQLPAHELVMLL